MKKVLDFALEEDKLIIDFCNEHHISLWQFFILHQRTGRKAHEDFNLTQIEIELNKFRDGSI